MLLDLPLYANKHRKTELLENKSDNYLCET